MSATVTRAATGVVTGPLASSANGAAAGALAGTATGAAAGALAGSASGAAAGALAGSASGAAAGAATGTLAGTATGAAAGAATGTLASAAATSGGEASHAVGGAPSRPDRTTLVRAFTAPKGFGDATLRDRVPDAIALMGGVPDPSVLPAAEVTEATARVLARPGLPALQYSRTEGDPALRAWIATREGVDPARIVITNGGFHGLALTIQTVLERGDLIAVDNPTFPLFLRGLELADARIAPVPVGCEGLRVDVLADQLRRGLRPTALYTVPDFHNPSQGTLPLEQRHELVALAEHYGFVVLADNPYRELRFRAPDGELERPRSGAGLDAGPRDEPFNHSPWVVHVNTFTKTLGPGLRLGWLVLPEWLVPDVVALRARQDSHSSTFVQAVVAELLTLRPGLFDETLTRARALYRERSDALAGALAEAAPGAFDVDLPEGGLFLWPRLRDDAVDADRLAEDAARAGVLYQRGSFFASGPGTDADRHLRLSFGDTSAERLREAGRRLSGALAQQQR
ncbi:PLP-dependent aminotransferase family protein [Miniimonas arenae]|nr:PLP-dependent aminotransferase family protein [Miniimonas arenae]